MNVLIGKFPCNSLHKSNWGLTILVYLLPLLKAFDPLEYLPDKILTNIELKRKVKIHLILHLTQSMTDFGPISALNTER